MDASSMLEKALAYARKGKPVFPCGSNKRPLTNHGFKDATTDEAQIRKWWSKWPDAMIGMPTGKASGITVLDVDVDTSKGINGNDSLDELEKQYGKLPDTVEVRTPRGGRHIYFKCAPGICNSASKLGPGLDIRGEGGYVILPPSGQEGKRYEWK